MMKGRRAIKFALVTFIAGLSPSLTHAGALHCQTKEYAQYKDEAATPAGQVSLAHEHCQAQISIDGAQKQMQIGMDGHSTPIVDAATSDITSCTAEQSKIQSALKAAKAKDSIWRFISANCQGPTP